MQKYLFIERVLVTISKGCLFRTASAAKWIAILSAFHLSRVLSPAQSPDFSVNSLEWYREMRDNIVAFNLKYKGKSVLVSGQVRKINEDGILVDIAEGIFPMWTEDAVWCVMKSSERQKLATLKRGQPVKVLGQYRGQKTKPTADVLTDGPQLEQCEIYLGEANTPAASVDSRAQDKDVDVTGTWTSSFTNQDGQVRESSFKLKAEGEKLTGTISGRQNDSAIEEGTIKGEEISFKVTREFNNNKVTTKYTGKVSSDTIKGKSETQRDGEPRSREFVAKKELPAK